VPQPGLEALYRQHRQYQASDEARVFLRRLATTGGRAGQATPLDMDARVRRTALLALQAARDQDYPTLRDAAADGDFQVRRLVAGSVNLLDPQMAAIGDALATDTAFQVRYDLLSPYVASRSKHARLRSHHRASSRIRLRLS
jgi:hypothetical protein